MRGVSWMILFVVVLRNSFPGLLCDWHLASSVDHRHFLQHFSVERGRTAPDCQRQLWSPSGSYHSVRGWIYHWCWTEWLWVDRVVLVLDLGVVLLRVGTTQYSDPICFSELGLKSPIYKNTARNGHFGHSEFPWEKAKDLKIRPELAKKVIVIFFYFFLWVNRRLFDQRITLKHYQFQILLTWMIPVIKWKKLSYLPFQLHDGKSAKNGFGGTEAWIQCLETNFHIPCNLFYANWS